MTRRNGWKVAVGVVLVVALVGGAGVLAQFFGGGRGRGGRGRGPVPVTEDRKGVPDWNVDPRFKSDVFTFAPGSVRLVGRALGLGRRRSAVGNGFSRQRPELFVPAPAVDLAQGQPGAGDCSPDR